MIDTERAELDVSNAVNIIRVYLNRLDSLSTDKLPKDERDRLSRTANIFNSKLHGLANTSRKLVTMYPRQI